MAEVADTAPLCLHCSNNWLKRQTMLANICLHSLQNVFSSGKCICSAIHFVGIKQSVICLPNHDLLKQIMVYRSKHQHLKWKEHFCDVIPAGSDIFNA